MTTFLFLFESPRAIEEIQLIEILGTVKIVLLNGMSVFDPKGTYLLFISELFQKKLLITNYVNHSRNLLNSFSSGIEDGKKDPVPSLSMPKQSFKHQ